MTTDHADLESHHIEGYARAALEQGRDGYFSVPLISHVEGNLHVGGCRDGVRLPDDFRYVVSLYKWERYALGPDTERFEVEMYDAADMPSADTLAQVAARAGEYVKRGKTLIHCQAGLNRSNLVAALVLIEQGRSPREAIDLLRERRSPVSLCNATFEAYLLSLGKDAA